MARLSRTLILVTSVCLSLAPGRASAQGVNGGIEGGLAVTGLSNLTNAIDFGGPVDVNRRKGFALGAFVRTPVHPSVAVRIETLLTTKGASPTDGSNALKVQLRYLDVPVLLDIRPSSMKPLYVLVGPSLNFNIAAKTIESVKDLPQAVEEDVRDKIRNVEIAIVVGAGLAVGKGFVDARYAAGLTDIAGDPSLHAPVKNRGTMVLAGVRF